MAKNKMKLSEKYQLNYLKIAPHSHNYTECNLEIKMPSKMIYLLYREFFNESINVKIQTKETFFFANLKIDSISQIDEGEIYKFHARMHIFTTIKNRRILSENWLQFEFTPKLIDYFTIPSEIKTHHFDMHQHEYFCYTIPHPPIVNISDERPPSPILYKEKTYRIPPCGCCKQLLKLKPFMLQLENENYILI